MSEDTEDMSEGSDLLLEIRQRYESARSHASKWREEARENFDLYAGRQWSEQDRQKPNSNACLSPSTVSPSSSMPSLAMR